MPTTSDPNVPGTSVISPVEIFIGNLKRVSEDLQPLIDWAHDFNVSTGHEDIRDVIQICQVIHLFVSGYLSC